MAGMKACIHLVLELTLLLAMVLVVAALPSAQQMWETRAVNEQLLNAASSGDEEAFDAAIEGGASVNAQDTSGTTPLHYAALGGHVRLVGRLLVIGADPDAANKCGITPITEAAAGDHVEAVEALLRNGAGATDDAIRAAERADAFDTLSLLRRWRETFPAMTGGRHVQSNPGGDR
jgi:hypothetical protein